MLTRQGLPVLDRTEYSKVEDCRRGGYIISDCNSNPDIVIYSSGSEVCLSLEVKKALKEKYNIRVVNMFCWELFEKQSDNYKELIYDNSSALLVSIEAGITQGWQKFTGLNGLNIGIDTFGESAPGKDVASHFGLISESIIDKISIKMEKMSEYSN